MGILVEMLSAVAFVAFSSTGAAWLVASCIEVIDDWLKSPTAAKSP